MKKITILFICLFTCFLLSAQQSIPKGALLLGADIGFNSINSTTGANNTKSTRLSFSPSFGIAIKPNLFYGVVINYSNFRQPISNASSSGNTNKSLGGGVFIRKYKPLAKNFSAYLNSNLSFLSSEVTFSYRNGTVIELNTTKGNGVNLALTPGISYKISSVFQLESGFRDIAGISINKSKFTSTVASTTPSTTNSVNLFTSLNNFTSQLFFGFRLLLENGKFKAKK